METIADASKDIFGLTIHVKNVSMGNFMME